MSPGPSVSAGHECICKDVGGEMKLVEKTSEMEEMADI